MMYLGGKAMIAPKLVAVINRTVGARRPCWEPFMGGAGMTEELAKTRRGLASDAHPALMAMWIAVRNGWRPPHQLSREDYERAKMLPDSDPLKAFAGFPMSYGASYFSAFAKDVAKVDTRWVPGRVRPYRVVIRNRVREARRSVINSATAFRHWELAHLDFFDREPAQMDSFIYADPPYEGTAGYSLGAFPHARFWKRCQEWARHVPVLVSEYSCPVPHELLFETKRSSPIGKVGSNTERSPVECLFRVLPATAPSARLRVVK